MAGCLNTPIGSQSSEQEDQPTRGSIYEVSVSELLSPQYPIQIEATIPRTKPRRMQDPGADPTAIAPNDPATVQLQISNVSEAPVKIEGPRPAPFGVLTAEGPFGSFPLLSDAYENVESIHMNGDSVIRESRSQGIIELGTDETLTRSYAISWGYNDYYSIHAPLLVERLMRTTIEGVTSSVSLRVVFQVDEHPIQRS